MANAAPWASCSIVPTDAHGGAFADHFLVCCVILCRNAVATHHFGQQQECILENVSMISVEAGSILVALSRIDKECDHLVLKALKTCDIPVPFMTY
jgi:hypothetical protein